MSLILVFKRWEIILGSKARRNNVNKITRQMDYNKNNAD